MTVKLPDYFPRNINVHANQAGYVAQLNLTRDYVMLGAPAVTDPDGIDDDIDADAVATTVTAQNYTFTDADCPYGRTLVMRMNADPGNAAVIAVRGKDYLGQPMYETFTHANGSTSIVYGRKAFKYVQDTVIVTPATNSVTCELGWGNSLGLPWQTAGLLGIQEDGAEITVFPRVVTLKTDIDAASAIAGGSKFLRSPVPGYISALRGIPHGGGGANDPVVTVELGGVAVTGLTVTVDTSNAAGLVVSDTPTTPGYNANNILAAGGMIELAHAAAASAGPITLEVDIINYQLVEPDLTDPATATTSEPRGLFTGITPFDGTREFRVIPLLDSRLSSANPPNGGLFGVPHYYP